MFHVADKIIRCPSACRKTSAPLFQAWAMNEIHDLNDKVCKYQDEKRDLFQLQSLHYSYSWLRQTVFPMDKNVSEMWEAAEGPYSASDTASDLQVTATILNTTKKECVPYNRTEKLRGINIDNGANEKNVHP